MYISYQKTSMRMHIYERQEAFLRCNHLPYISMGFFSDLKYLASLDNGSCLRVKESTGQFLMKK